MKLRLFGLSLMLASAPAIGHDFWLQPVRFQTALNAVLPATFQVGHGAARERWNNNDRVVALNSYHGGRRSDRRRDLQSGGPADFVLRFAAPGMHILGMQSSYAFSELPAARFNDYLKEEGLVALMAARRRSGTSSAAGRERYSRRAKALIQVGAARAGDDLAATRAIGLKLEIVPDKSPYALSADRTLPIHVLYNGRRLANATIKLTNLANDAKPVAVAVTDRAGQARFRVPATGNWLLNVVWGEAIAGDRRFDFDTTFSSLTFGYPPRPRA